ncbi:hypothetical protein FHU25_004261 [Clostridium saccharobutylicum]|nr:hypothetical protein [Clostridium saccharobutylicum]NSA20196.1 hypothetical protein [Clostridium saccharobutylicum]
MFNKIPNKKYDKQMKEMMNLAYDISRDGLNPFEFPIVWYDEEIQKYIVIDGNRRITCIKLMLQYKNNEKISTNVPDVGKIYNIKPNIDMSQKIECIVYENLEEAKKVLSKIHQDSNDGIGRIRWDAQVKRRANAREGNKDRTFSIIEFVKNNSLISEELLNKMNSNRWSSKLERVIGFAKFKTIYNITFNENNDIQYLDDCEQTFKMLSKLISDIIDNVATNNFRLKEDFNEYIEKLPDEYKSQVNKDGIAKQDSNESEESNDSDDSNLKDDCVYSTGDKPENDSSQSSKANIEDKDDVKNEKDLDGGSAEEPSAPKKITPHSKNANVALRLSREYTEQEYLCLGEKGKQILAELESLNYNCYPQAAAGLCRSIMEYTAKLWMGEFSEEFNGNQLATYFGKCVNMLRNKKY